MNKKAKIAIIVSIVLIAAGGGTACIAHMANNIAAVETMSAAKDTVEAEVKDVSNYVSTSGKVEGGNSVKIAAPANTKVLKLNTELGSAVKKGEKLCVFDSEDLQETYDSLLKKSENSDDLTDSTHSKNKRALETAKEDKSIALRDASDALEKAKKERDKAYNKYNDEVKKYNENVSKRDTAYDEFKKADDSNYDYRYEKYMSLDQTVTSQKAQVDAMYEALSGYDDQVKSAQRQYDAVDRSTDQSVQAAQDVIDSEKYSEDDSIKKQLKDLKKQIDDCNVKAPIDGVITGLTITEGGLPETSSIITIEDTEHLKITVTIKENDIMRLKEGMRAEITADALPDKTFPGTVSRLVLVPINSGTGADQGGSGMSMYTADISIDDKDCGLLLGMKAKVRIILSEAKKTLSVPFDAVVTDSDGSKKVFIAEKQSDGTYKAKEAEITVSLETDYDVAVKSSQLKEGDKVILDAEGISDGDTVDISENTFDFGGGE